MLESLRNYLHFEWLVLKDCGVGAAATLRKYLVEEGAVTIVSVVVAAVLDFYRKGLDFSSVEDSIFVGLIAGALTAFFMGAMVLLARVVTAPYRLWRIQGGRRPNPDRTEVYVWMSPQAQTDKIAEQYEIKQRITILENKNSAGLSPLEIESKDRQLCELKARSAILQDELDIPVPAETAARWLLRMLRDDGENLALLKAAVDSGDSEFYLVQYLVRNSGVRMYGYHPINDEIFYMLAVSEVRKSELAKADTGQTHLVSQTGKLRYRNLHFKRNEIVPFIQQAGR